MARLAAAFGVLFLLGAPQDHDDDWSQRIRVTGIVGGMGASIQVDESEPIFVRVGESVAREAGRETPELRDVILVRLEDGAAVFRRGTGAEVRIALGEAGAEAEPAAAPRASLAGTPYRPEDYTSEERGPYWLIDPAERDWLQDNLDEALEQIEVEPNPEGEGVRIVSIAEGSIWAARGLNVGDVILRVNQYSLSRPEDVETLIGNLREENPGQVSLLIHRNGRQIVRVFRVTPYHRQEAPRPAPAYAQRLGGRRDLVARGGGSARTEDAVSCALKWLVRHQNEDGSWSMAVYTERCGRHEESGRCEPTGLWSGIDTTRFNVDVGLTGLALLALLGSGFTPASLDAWPVGRPGDAVVLGLRFLRNQQDGEGCVGPRTTEGYMYNHLIASMALAEAYGMTQDAALRDAAARGVRFTIAAQNPGRGWRYSVRPGDNDSSVTGWAVLSLKAAEAAGIEIEGTAYEGAMAWFETVLFRERDGRWGAGYETDEDLPVFIPGVNDQYNQHPTMTAIWMTCETLIAHRRTTRLEGGLHALSAGFPAWPNAPAMSPGVDFYYWYHATQAMFQLDGPDGPAWTAWNEAMTRALTESQNADEGECRFGSWEPVDRWSCKGGRVYATAINALTLETYYRHVRVLEEGR